MSSELRRGRLQGLLIAAAILAILGVGYVLASWLIERSRTPDIGVPVYRGSSLENTVHESGDDVTYYFTAPASRDQLFAFYQGEGASCGEGMCYGPVKPCGRYYVYISGTTQGVTRIALEVDTAGCDQP